MQKFLIALIIVAALGGGYMFWQGSTEPAETITPEPFPTSPTAPTPAPSTATPTPSPTTPTPAPSTAPLSATVTYNGTTFSPAEVRIAKGGTVSWINASDKNMWVGSAAHPSHTVYSGTSLREHCTEGATPSFDQCKGGSNYSFTFEKTGTWGYHDHLTPSATGKVIVE